MLELVPAVDGSAYQEYRLTEKGRGLWPVIVALGQWGNEGHAAQRTATNAGRQGKRRARGQALNCAPATSQLLNPGDTMMARIDE